ncbi:MAG: RNase adapter RapZ [Rothia sp. (in: high G+C Gram-positive bacteria)]|uniref:RNase adapter RapZ n=1 Tax=Rothia sp. (in: high G+C Gram-positive bacteria) TaxID=1885016 RepID=UPI0026DFAA0E|nr:RNase adapter RapZ [Rothia sp. (in: high G+C Gram-positive bacteria)]MDO5750741.1 RNase adapter RapZ [Rothia sp. (in: high G+C Gram-positive bacteria)]
MSADTHAQTGSERPQILVITGISGAGRSTVANVLEDEGWYVIDNIPPQMLGTLTQLVTSEGSRVSKVALGIDVRARALFADLPAAIEELRKSNVDFSMLFLDAKDETIIARYEAQRRPHPLQGEGRILDGINAERTLFEALRTSADRTIDTTGMNVHQLAATVREMYAEGVNAKKLNLTVMSFGFKYGAPTDAHYVADMRFIPNPHWIPELRPLTGQDAPVRDYVLSQAGTEEFISNYIAALRPVLEGYRREGKYYATIGIGCTGGKHRSVAVTEEIARRLSAYPGVNVNVQHRDKGRE